MNKNTFESKRYWIDNIDSLSYGYIILLILNDIALII